MEVSVLSNVKDCWLIKATRNLANHEVTDAYKKLIKLFNGKAHVCILQDFTKLEDTISLEEFDEMMQLCHEAGVKRMTVATVTNDMSRAYTGVLFQDVGEKYDIQMNLKYSRDVEAAKKWLEDISEI